MKKKELMRDFISIIMEKRLLTLFIKNVFEYDNLNDYNYIFRMVDDGDKIIIDIYDNVSDHRFNRYIFNFGKSILDMKSFEQDNVFVTCINVALLNDSVIGVLRLGYLFKLKKSLMIDYAKNIFDDEIIEMLDYVLKKPI